MQKHQDLSLPTVALVSSIADELYEKLLVDQALWEEEPTEIQSVFKKLSVDTKVKDGQLFKLYKDNWLPYECLSLRTDSVVASKKDTGHGGIQKTLAQLQKHCYWKSCLPSEVQEKYIIHIEEEMIQFTSMKLGLIITSAAFKVALDELKRTMMYASFLYLILLKTSVEHNILILTDMGYLMSQQEESSYEISISYCSEVPNFYQRSYHMVGRKRLPTEADPNEKIALYYYGNAAQKEDCLSRLPVIILIAFVHDEMHFNPLTDLSLWGEEIITAHSALENSLVSVNVKDYCLFMEYKYLLLANICSSLQLDSVIVDQGPTGRVYIQRALFKQDYYQELIISHNNKTKNECNELLYHPAMVLNIRHCRTADKPLLQLSHGCPPDLPCCLLSLMKPRLSVTPEAYLQKLPQVLINTEDEAYHAKLNIKKKDVDHASNSHPTIPLYKVGDPIYFYSNRGYECENTLVMLWQGPIKANHKMDPVNYTKNPNAGHLITRVHTQYMCAAPSTHE
ncbi:hypothetical protein DSO57_1005874 [Entomophthora muscae]|uniref:Uncharacterized protein n=1 Tax=Entomophthora muscae TaxID=34485 RepID=A0ACC2RMJ8_9FUNG|nr:hypothetical protein DSO57_1005874 [Entomophthora muscae]